MPLTDELEQIEKLVKGMQMVVTVSIATGLHSSNKWEETARSIRRQLEELDNEIAQTVKSQT